ncbi:MAG: calcium/sodium antiporter [Lachnospiraceae bacterium]|nr:calcium/sodium antiporter [Lachnospiraceae bacterium]MDD6192223.1 calcium/sodium antiporter [Lachnospiraceae bacterium]MDY4792799.1 calcium/sodium antiporter [Pararoseburia sp.]
MTVLKAVIVLVVGFVLLVKGADFFVEGASSVAKMLKVPSLIIGMTIVAMGTSLPETSVSIAASINNQNTLAVSNVVGSNIFNLMVVLGVCAVMCELQVSKDVLKRDYPFSVICAILLLVAGYIGMTLGRVDGIIFLVIFVGFLFVLIKSAMDARKRGEISEKEREMNEEISEMKEQPVWKSILYIVGGAIAIKYGGDWVVDSASTIATSFGISATLVGLTICSVGTSLPELVTSIVAARKNELDMAIGNVVGSNVFNILMVLGIAASVSPIAFLTENVIDIIILLVFSLITWLFCVTKKRIGRMEGITMLALYGIYLVYICIR